MDLAEFWYHSKDFIKGKDSVIFSKIILWERIKDSMSLHVDVDAGIFTSYTLHRLAIALGLISLKISMPHRFVEDLINDTIFNLIYLDGQ